MSYAYSQVIPEVISYRTYGFQNVSPKEMYSIVRRLQKPTYNSELYHGERYKTKPCPPRDPSIHCRRAKSASTERPRERPIPVFTTERDLDRVYRRVRTPTICKMAAEGKITPSYETNFDEHFRNNFQREYTPLEQKKMTSRLLRPTTAFKSKSSCSVYDDPVVVKYRQYDFSADNDCAESDVIQEIVDRVRTPTIASEGGIGPTCPKRKDSIGKRASMNNVPLVSGLPRSKNIDEIVNRLYTPTEAIPILRPTSAKTLQRKDKHIDDNRRRPKSASSLVGSQYLRSLSSYRSNNSSRASSYRSKFSTASEYDSSHKTTAIYIKRKPPTGKKVEIDNRPNDLLYNGNKSGDTTDDDSRGKDDSADMDKNKAPVKMEDDHDLSDKKTKHVSYQSDEENVSRDKSHSSSESEQHKAVVTSTGHRAQDVHNGNDSSRRVKQQESTEGFNPTTDEETDRNMTDYEDNKLDQYLDKHVKNTNNDKPNTSKHVIMTTDSDSSFVLNDEPQQRSVTRRNDYNTSDDSEVHPPSLSISDSGRSSPNSSKYSLHYNDSPRAYSHTSSLEYSPQSRSPSPRPYSRTSSLGSYGYYNNKG